MFITQASMVVRDFTSVRPSIVKPCNSSPEVITLQDKFSSLLTNSDAISADIARLLKEEFGQHTVYSKSLVCPAPPDGTQNWVHVALLGDKDARHPLKRSIEISVGNDSRFPDEIAAEMEHYSFAIYKYGKYGDRMSWHKPFEVKGNYQYSVTIPLEELTRIPANDFQATVRRNYIHGTPPDGSIFVLPFRKDKDGTSNNDYLLIHADA